MSYCEILLSAAGVGSPANPPHERPQPLKPLACKWTSSLLRGSDNSDLTGLETSKIRNPQFQHISM